jgi:hypothetical protein
MQISTSANFRIAASLVLLTILIGVAFIGYLPQIGGRFASANSDLVQSDFGFNDFCSTSCSIAVHLPSDVSAGDVLVV